MYGRYAIAGVLLLTLDHPTYEGYEKIEEELFEQKYDTRRWYMPWTW